MTNDAPQKDIARRVNVDAATVSRWKGTRGEAGQRPSADAVLRFANSYGVSPVVALIQAGILDESEVARHGSDVIHLPDPTGMNNAQLIAEIARRLECEDGSPQSLAH